MWYKGRANQLTGTSTLIFAALWFPDNDVETAIAVNVVGFYLEKLGLIAPSKLMKLKIANAIIANKYTLDGKKTETLPFL